MRPVICIGHQFASGGREIGERVAQELDIPFYDNEVITEAVKATGISESFIRNNDEVAVNSLIYSIAMGHFSGMGSPYIEAPADKVFQVQTDVIRGFAQKGPCVIVGRSAGEILKDDFECFRIFIYADMNFRIKRATEQYGYPKDGIEEFLRKEDQERRAYYTRYTNCKWGSIESFDLAIDSSICSIENVAKTILAYIKNYEE